MPQTSPRERNSLSEGERTSRVETAKKSNPVWRRKNRRAYTLLQAVLKPQLCNFGTRPNVFGQRRKNLWTILGALRDGKVTKDPNSVLRRIRVLFTTSCEVYNEMKLRRGPTRMFWMLLYIKLAEKDELWAKLGDIDSARWAAKVYSKAFIRVHNQWIRQIKPEILTTFTEPVTLAEQDSDVEDSYHSDGMSLTIEDENNHAPFVTPAAIDGEDNKNDMPVEAPSEVDDTHGNGDTAYEDVLDGMESLSFEDWSATHISIYAWLLRVNRHGPRADKVSERYNHLNIFELCSTFVQDTKLDRKKQQATIDGLTLEKWQLRAENEQLRRFLGERLTHISYGRQYYEAGLRKSNTQ